MIFHNTDGLMAALPIWTSTCVVRGEQETLVTESVHPPVPFQLTCLPFFALLALQHFELQHGGSLTGKKI